MQEQSSGGSKWLRSFGYIILTVLVFASVKGLANSLFSSGNSATSARSKADAINAGLQQAAAQLKKQLPIRVDEITTMIDVITTDKRILYIMSVDEEIDASNVESVKSKILEINSANICRQVETRRLVDMGATLAWSYSTKNGVAFSVSVSDCT